MVLNNLSNNIVDKRLAIGAVVIIISLVIAFFVSGILSSNDQPAEEPEEDAVVAAITDRSAGRVFIVDAKMLQKDITQKERRYIESMLFNKVISINNKPIDLYTATIRPGSYSPTTSKDIKTIRFFVDIKLANLTYEIIVRDVRGSKTISTVCAPASQQLTDKSNCIEGGYA